MFARKGVFSSIGRAGAVATVVAVALTAVEPSLAFAGSATQARASPRRPGPATRPISAPAAGIIAAAAVPRPRRPLPASSARGIAIAATQNRRDYYDVWLLWRRPAYYGGPAPYYGARRLL